MVKSFKSIEKCPYEGILALDTLRGFENETLRLKLLDEYLPQIFEHTQQAFPDNFPVSLKPSFLEGFMKENEAFKTKLKACENEEQIYSLMSQVLQDSTTSTLTKDLAKINYNKTLILLKNKFDKGYQKLQTDSERAKYLSQFLTVPTVSDSKEDKLLLSIEAELKIRENNAEFQYQYLSEHSMSVEKLIPNLDWELRARPGRQAQYDFMMGKIKELLATYQKKPRPHAVNTYLTVLAARQIQSISTPNTQITLWLTLKDLIGQKSTMENINELLKEEQALKTRLFNAHNLQKTVSNLLTGDVPLEAKLMGVSYLEKIPNEQQRALLILSALYTQQNYDIPLELKSDLIEAALTLKNTNYLGYLKDVFSNLKLEGLNTDKRFLIKIVMGEIESNKPYPYQQAIGSSIKK